jgi:hypothetical protein
MPRNRIGNRPDPKKVKHPPLPKNKTVGLDPKGHKGAAKLPGNYGKNISKYKPLPWGWHKDWLRIRVGLTDPLLLGWGNAAWISNFQYWGFDNFIGPLVGDIGGDCIPLLPEEGPGGDIIYPVGGGGSFPCPASIDPGFPCVWAPNSSDDPSGAGVAMCIDPGTIQGGEVDEGEVDDADILEQAASSIWQVTRFLRVANDTKTKVKVYVKYHAPTEDGDWAWAPGNPDDDAVSTYELDAGEIVDLADNDWQINGDCVRIWAESIEPASAPDQDSIFNVSVSTRAETRKWERFKNKDLWLVPETDPDGNHGYVAQQIETFVFTIR